MYTGSVPFWTPFMDHLEANRAPRLSTPSPPEALECNVSCFRWLLELSCFDQRLPSPAPSFWMKTETESQERRFIYCHRSRTATELPSGRMKGFIEAQTFTALRKIAFPLAHCLFWCLAPFKWKRTVRACLSSFSMRVIPSVLRHRLSIFRGSSNSYLSCEHPISSQK